jgi:5-methylcytosine-specific restriction endonuclease McrA
MGSPLILQLDAQGQPTKWITWQDAVVYYAKDLVSWEVGTFDNTIFGGNNRITGKQSSIKTSSIIAVKGAVNGKKRRREPTLNNKELFGRDRHICAYCITQFSDSKLTRDHVIPTSRNGKNIWMNVVTACKRCNQKKNDRTPEEANMPLAYLPYVPSRAEHLILQNRNILTDQMDFLLSFVDEKSRLLIPAGELNAKAVR